MELEDRLRRALRRVEPGEDFAARVLARLDAPPPRVRRPQRWAIAASVLLLAGAGAVVQHQRAQARHEAAGRQLAYALALTSRELQSVHQHLAPLPKETGT
jgi:hypothetical protein